ncbi:esterase-like activity of phytase family protein [Ferrovibrio sp.]|uniref:esterase-like activity of phytase family protein n=1 Tax=Ferrovibrio sp. TaxID=1917215 RepID=UPI003919157F
MISLALLLLLAIGQPLAGPGAQAGARAEPLAVRSVPLELLPGQAEQAELGRLRYLGGLVLAAEGDVFGGYSGIAVDFDGGGLWAISDLGHWLRLDFARDAAGLPVDVMQARHLPLADARGQPVTRKSLSDAEALRRLPDGSWLVGFERAHRFWTYAEPGGPAQYTLPVPPGFETQPDNGGAEAVAVWPNGDLLVLSEEKESGPGHTSVWLHQGGMQGGAWSDLSWPVRDGFKPTDAVALPDGDVLVLERYFTPLTGPKARISRVTMASIRPDAVLQPETLAEWARPYSVDNMEALDMRRADDGSLWLYVMSDDNRNSLQRTLLMVFRLEK